MNFSSIPFLFFFLPLVFALYYLVPRKAKDVCLVVFSLVFYAWGGLSHTLLLVLTILVDYACGLLIGKRRFRRAGAGAARAVHRRADIVINLGTARAGSNMPACWPIRLTGRHRAHPSPCRRSRCPSAFHFIRLRAFPMRWTSTNSRRNRDAESCFDFATYLSFFPHVTSGPITRYRDTPGRGSRTAAKRWRVSPPELCPLRQGIVQEGAPRRQRWPSSSDRVQYTRDIPPRLPPGWACSRSPSSSISIFPATPTWRLAWAACSASTLPENFDHPYASRSASEFWRRWHMTLGGWFRDYVYIPLGGNRHGTLLHRSQPGRWFGCSRASGTGPAGISRLWGAYYAVLIICGKAFPAGRLLDRNRLPLCSGCTAFLAAVIGWVFFSYTDIGAGVRHAGRHVRLCPAAGADSARRFTLSSPMVRP